MKDTTEEPVGSASWLQVVREQVRTLQFGVVQIVVHDRRVVQIERTEKLRLDKPATASVGYEL